MSLRPDATLDKFAHRGDGRLPGLIGVRFTGVAENRIDAELDIRPELLAPNGYLHAATVIALADTACGYGSPAWRPLSIWVTRHKSGMPWSTIGHEGARSRSSAVRS